MHQTKKGNQYYFGAKAHIGAECKGGLVHSVCTSTAFALVNLYQLRRRLVPQGA
jgi:IS5 family transposase